MRKDLVNCDFCGCDLSKADSILEMVETEINPETPKYIPETLPNPVHFCDIRCVARWAVDSLAKCK